MNAELIYNTIDTYLLYKEKFKGFVNYEFKPSVLKDSSFTNLMVSFYEYSYLIRGWKNENKIDQLELYSSFNSYDNNTGIDKLIELIQNIKKEKIKYKLNRINSDFED